MNLYGPDVDSRELDPDPDLLLGSRGLRRGMDVERDVMERKKRMEGLEGRCILSNISKRVV